MEVDATINALTGQIVDAAHQIHQDLGPGLMEHVYQAVLTAALEKRGLAVEPQRAIAFEYDGLRFDNGLRVDLLVEGVVVVELKSAESMARAHWKQVLTYLRVLDLPVGLLINFGMPTMREGLSRVLNPRFRGPVRRLDRPE
jgi:iron complex transport system substrate-binding protein